MKSNNNQIPKNSLTESSSGGSANQEENQELKRKLNQFLRTLKRTNEPLNPLSPESSELDKFGFTEALLGRNMLKTPGALVGQSTAQSSSASNPQLDDQPIEGVSSQELEEGETDHLVESGTEVSSLLDDQHSRATLPPNSEMMQEAEDEREDAPGTLNRELSDEEAEKGFLIVNRFMNILNKSDDYMSKRKVDPERFRAVGKKLYNYLTNSLEDRTVPIDDYHKACNELNKELEKLEQAGSKL